MWSDAGRDVRYALRGLRQAPAFAATVVATLALGIGANSAIFSAVDAVLLRDALVSDPESLVDVHTSSGNNLYSSSSYPDYFDLRDSGTFASLAAYTPVSITMDANGQPEPLAGQLVSGNYFDVLGIAPLFGRGFTSDDDRPGAPVRVAVISDALWRRSFNADQSLVGRTLRFNSNPYTVIGIAPPGFVGPHLGAAIDVWVPTALQPEVDPPAAAVRRARGHSAIFDLRRSRVEDGGPVRVAIGASRTRLVRQWLTESVLLGMLGSLGALLVARLTTPLLHMFVIPEAVDPLTFAGGCVVLAIAGLAAALIPALRAMRVDPISTLRQS